MNSATIATVRVSTYITAQGPVISENKDGSVTIDAGQKHPVIGTLLPAGMATARVS